MHKAAAMMVHEAAAMMHKCQHQGQSKVELRFLRQEVRKCNQATYGASGAPDCCLLAGRSSSDGSAGRALPLTAAIEVGSAGITVISACSAQGECGPADTSTPLVTREEKTT